MKIKIRHLAHSKINVERRKMDTPDVDGKLNPKLIKQSKCFTRDILDGVRPEHMYPTLNGVKNPAFGFLSSSTFIVEPITENTAIVDAIVDGVKVDTANKTHATLSGSHRLAWFEFQLAHLHTLLAQGKKAHLDAPDDTSIIAEVKRLNDVIASWNDFEVECDIRNPQDDATRLRIVAEGNGDEADKDSKIQQNYPSRFIDNYDAAPTPDYLFEIEMDSKGKAKTDRYGNTKVMPLAYTEAGWTSTKYRLETRIGGSNHVPYSALTRLGKHFGLTAQFFAVGNRLQIRSQVTAAYLGKESPIGEGSDVTNVMDYGIEFRYCLARANCKGREALDACKTLYYAEFMEIMDEAGNGANALGNTKVLTAEEKKAEKAEKVAREEERAEQNNATLADAADYAHERGTLQRFLKVPNAPTLSPSHGNLFDLLLNVNADTFDASKLAAYKSAKGDVKAIAANAALTSVVEALMRYTGVQPYTTKDTERLDAFVAEIERLNEEAKRHASEIFTAREELAAHATANTKKSKK